MLADREKWNKKHGERTDPPSINALLREWASPLTGGTALDLACGPGQNSLYLASLGFTVDAVDISAVALADLKHPGVTTHEQDLDTYRIPPGAYDLILNSLFLDRRLYEGIYRGLAAEGMLVFETWLASSTAVRNPKFKLREGELAEAFSQLEILSYREYAGLASLVARKKK